MLTFRLESEESEIRGKIGELKAVKHGNEGRTEF